MQFLCLAQSGAISTSAAGNDQVTIVRSPVEAEKTVCYPSLNGLWVNARITLET